MTIDQHTIKEWFDKTYRRRGLNYLRPLEAYEVFMTLLEANQGGTLLDVACGPGQMLLTGRQSGLQVAGVDISEEAIRMARQRVPESKVLVGNAESLPFDDMTFHYVTCIGSLERFINRDKALAEMYRVGKPNARYCLMVRNSERMSWRIVKDYLGIRNEQGHQDALSYERWKALFEKCGFRVTRVERDQWPRLRWKRWFNIFSGTIDYTAVKPDSRPVRNAYEFIFILEKSGNGQ